MNKDSKPITAADRDRIRSLAGRYAEIANSEEMNRRREVWRLSNRLEKRTVPFQIEDNGTFFNDLLPEPVCSDDPAKSWEKRLLMAITNFELIPDDRVIPPYFAMEWTINIPEVLPALEKMRGDDGHGGSLGYTTNKPLADLPNSLHLLERGQFTVDRETMTWNIEAAESTFGDILPVRPSNGSIVWHGCGMAMRAVNWIGMENLFYLMVDAPESVHAFFDFISRERVDYFDWLEDEKLLTPNYGEFCVGSGSCGYTDELPRGEVESDEDLRCSDCWSFQESQEATGISPDMFAEFIFPYQKRVSERFGLIYYGCCEPVHDLYPVIKDLKNVRKITVSPWCNQESIAGQLGKNVVISRKPHPMKLCSETFDEAGFRAHVQETLDAGKDNFVEFIFRDTCTLKGSMKDRLVKACGIMREIIESS